MKKYYVMFLSISFFFISCLSTHTYDLQLPNGSSGLKTDIQIVYTNETLNYEDKNINAKLFIETRKYITLEVTNKTDRVIELLNENNTFNRNNITARLVPNALDSFNISNKNIPSILIGPTDTVKVNYYNEKIISAISKLNNYHTRNSEDSSKLNISNWVPVENLENSSAIFEYSIDNNKNYIIFSNLGKNIESVKITESTDSQYQKKLGHINTNIIVSHFLFVQNKEEKAIMKIARKKAYNQAIKKYENKDIVLKNITYKGNWSLLSLLYYCDFFGWAENISISADVYGKE